MKSLADSVVYAVAYINARESEDEGLDDDVAALESIAGILTNASEEELTALAAAANRALTDEQSQALPRETFVNAYSQWMENMFGEPWVGNDRCDPL